MSGSTAPAAKAAILTFLQARAGLAGVNVTWGGPTSEDEVVEEFIYLGDVEGKEDWSSLGQQRREENYSIELFVAVRQDGDDERSTEERAWTIFKQVEGAFSADPSLGGFIAGTGWAELQDWKQRNAPLLDRWITRIDVKVHVKARKVTT